MEAATAYATLFPKDALLEDPVVQAWLQQAVPGMPSLWTLLKASAAAALQPEFAWTVAGEGICYLRAHQAAGGVRGPVLVLPELFGVLKVGKVKTAKAKKRLEDAGMVGEGAAGGHEKEADAEGEDRDEDEARDDVGWCDGSGVVGREEQADHTHDLDTNEEAEEDGEFFDARSSPMKTS